MIAVVGTLAWQFQVSLPLMARDVFGGGAGAYRGDGLGHGGRRGRGRPGWRRGRGRAAGRCAWPRSAGGSRSWWPRSRRRCRSSWRRCCLSGTARSRSTRWRRPCCNSRPRRRCAAGSWRCGVWPGSAPPPSAGRSSAGSARRGAPAGRRPCRRADLAVRSARAAGTGQDRPSPRRPVAACCGDVPPAALIYPERSRGFARSAHDRAFRGDQRRECHHRAQVMAGGVVERPAAGDKP